MDRRDGNNQSEQLILFVERVPQPEAIATSIYLFIHFFVFIDKRNEKKRKEKGNQTK